METLDAAEVSRLLREIGERLEMGGESPHRSRAYYRAADSLMALDRPLQELYKRGELRSIPGVGDVIDEKIQTILRTGTHPTLERLRSEFPAGLLELLQIPRLKPEKAATLYRELGVTDLDSLEAACRAGEVAGRKGLGPALQQRLLEGIPFARAARGQIFMHVARARADAACERLVRELPEVIEAVPAGCVRRGCELVETVVVAVRSNGVKAVPEAEGAVIHAGTTAQFGLTLLFATGSESHIQLLTDRARAEGLALTQSGIRKGAAALPAETEEEVYSGLGLAWIPPELREGRDEIELAERGELPDLVSQPDIRGIVHCHTDFSDGSNTLSEMAEAARARGMQYFGVADHSQSAFYAGGLKPDRLLEQGRLVDSLNERYASEGLPFRILKGTEADILADGALDFPDEVLAGLDFVVASVHSRFSMDESEQTARIIRAVSNPRTTILGHATGRLLLQRKGYDVDVEAILIECGRHQVAVEINANPHRLDLDWRWHRRGLELGCMFSINPDAHSIAELDLLRWGIAMARKGGVPADRVLNCLPLSGFQAHLAARHT